jgi:hypothetical protein
MQIKAYAAEAIRLGVRVEADARGGDESISGASG